MNEAQDIIVNPSMHEIWYANFEKAKQFHDVNGHLSVRCKSLSAWISYQRLHAKNLSERQITLLNSIGYKDTASGYRHCDTVAWKKKIEHSIFSKIEGGGMVQND